MKKWMILAIMLLTFSAAGQGRLGVKAGVNMLTVMPFSSTYGGANAHMGLFYSIKRSAKWSLQPELIISQNNFDSDVYGTVELTYLTIPVVFKQHLSEKWNFQIGAQYGALMDVQSNSDRTFLEFINSTDLSAVLGFGYSFNETLHVDLRAVPELTKIIYSNYGSLRKMNFQLSVGFVIPREGEWSKKEGNSN